MASTTAKAGVAVIALFVGMMVGGMAVGPLNQAITQNTGVQTVTNESVAASTSTYVELEGWHVIPGTDTVYWKNPSTGSYQQLNLSDYSIKTEAGTIKANASSGVSDGDTLLVNYQYRATDQMATRVAGLIVELFVAMMIWFPAMYVMDYGG